MCIRRKDLFVTVLILRILRPTFDAYKNGVYYGGGTSNELMSKCDITERANKISISFFPAIMTEMTEMKERDNNEKNKLISAVIISIISSM